MAFSTVRGLVGLDSVLVAITGAAPISHEILEWFNAIGVPLSEIYGMSESSGPMTWEAYKIKPGTVGPAIPGCEVKIADDGEVICRGGNVFRGYYNDPDKTAETLIDGWLHSGDIGVMDDDGYVTIVDRKKELIITSGGKNISPANLESALKMIPLVGQACAIGDARKFVSALLVLDAERAPVWAKERGIEFDTLDDLAANAEVVAEVQRGVDEANQPVRAGRADQEVHAPGRGVAARHRPADADVEAEAPRHPRPLRRRHRGHVRLTPSDLTRVLVLRDSERASVHVWGSRQASPLVPGPGSLANTRARATTSESVRYVAKCCWMPRRCTGAAQRSMRRPSGSSTV